MTHLRLIDLHPCILTAILPARARSICKPAHESRKNIAAREVSGQTADGLVGGGIQCDVSSHAGRLHLTHETASAASFTYSHSICAGTFGVKNGVTPCGVKLAGDFEGYPSVKKLVVQGDQAITVQLPL